MRQAKNKVAASFAAEGSMMNKLKAWNDMYGEGGSRKNEAHKQLSLMQDIHFIYANEAGASFIDVSSSTIVNYWFGQSEKNVRALFSLAAKVAPTVIFVDENDSILGQRGSNYECNAMRRIKNEFMSHWDGLLSKPDARVIVLGATNMPFDLDEAVIRRFQRRIMVGLPSAENRETIVKTILAEENHDDIDFKELSTMTEGYSGSDLKV
ncbi:elongation factor 1-alpha, partial [Trifolium medium]|nr:elongation factor 1-alpha [Trifolium medium]